MTPEPRIQPLPPEEWEGRVKRILETKPPGIGSRMGENNIFPTLARHPDLFQAWLPFGGHLLTAGKLSGRDRELLILRTAVRCESSYEWGQHVRISLAGGIDRETIDRVPEGPGAAGWSENEVALLRAADELHDDSRISDATWESLARTYDVEQMIEIVMVVGHYHMVAFALNSAGVELDEGLEPLPDR